MDEVFKQYSKLLIAVVLVVFVLGIFFFENSPVKGIGSIFDSTAREQNATKNEDLALAIESKKKMPTVSAKILDTKKSYSISDIFTGTDYKGDEAMVLLEEGFESFLDTGKIYFDKAGQYPVKVRVIDEEGRAALYEVELYVNEEML